jgi:pimeloyl-ACP methyl ester carboxylesterase
MKIPNFTSEGKLPTGLHICTGEEFINRFCSSKNRTQFEKPISDILDFAKDRGAIEIFVGGSFVSANEFPKDIDCVMVFNEDKYIPAKTEHVSIAGLKFDVLYASLESRDLIDSYLKLFSTCRYGSTNIGIIQIDLYARNQPWEIRHQPDEASFEIIKRVYNDRSLIDLNEREGVIVSIHGLLSRAEWNKEIAPVASAEGWIVAPYIYDTNKPDLLFSDGRRNKVVDDFREWIYDLSKRYEHNISIIAHSFGTYIIGAYLEGFEEKEFPPVSFDSIILTGSILNSNFDWEKHRGRSVGRIYNNIAPNDEFVKYMPKNDWKKIIGMSPLFGQAGVYGFTQITNMLTQSTNPIFSHTNTIRRDIIESKWMPFIKANKNSCYNDFVDLMKREKNVEK